MAVGDGTVQFTEQFICQGGWYAASDFVCVNVYCVFELGYVAVVGSGDGGCGHSRLVLYGLLFWFILLTCLRKVVLYVVLPDVAGVGPIAIQAILAVPGLEQRLYSGYLIVHPFLELLALLQGVFVPGLEVLLLHSAQIGDKVEELSCRHCSPPF